MNEGLCLLTRKETRFECIKPQLRGFIVKLKKLGFSQEKFFKNKDSTRINNLVGYNESDLGKKNYTRLRIRTYYSKKISSNNFGWFEQRQVNGKQITKTRKALTENSAHLTLLYLFFRHTNFVVVDYERIALNNEQMRITFDFDTKYLLPFNRKVIGKERIVFVKIKHTKKLSKEVLDVFKGLGKSRSKIKRANYFLKKVVK